MKRNDESFFGVKTTKMATNCAYKNRNKIIKLHDKPGASFTHQFDTIGQYEPVYK